MEGLTVPIRLDLLAGEYGGRSRRHEHQRVQGVRPRKARGCDLVFLAPVELTLQGRLPNGALDSAAVLISATAPFLVMKAMALADRLKQKDAYDIDYCLRHCPGGVAGAAGELTALVEHGLVREALGHLEAKFDRIDSVGPVQVVEFRQIADSAERAIEQRAAFERVRLLLSLVGWPYG